MEALSCLLKRVVEGNFITSCRFGGRDGGELVISHLLYADDTVLFCEANFEQLMYLGWTLMWFEAFSSLKMNLSKSEIIPVGRVDNVELLASELGGVGSLHTTYLGLPLRAPHRAMGVWDSIEERFRKIFHPGKDNISQRVGGSHSFGIHCLAFPFTSSLCLKCQSLCVLNWRRFRGLSLGGVAI